MENANDLEQFGLTKTSANLEVNTGLVLKGCSYNSASLFRFALTALKIGIFLSWEGFQLR